MHHHLLGFLGTALVAGLLTATPASAVPIQFGITGVQFNPGTGYGDDGTENGTLLEVEFSNTGFVAQSFSLNFVGDFATFLYGTVNFIEPNTGGGIVAAETDNLGVTADFTFTSPDNTLHTLTAVGTATAGAVSDAFVDYTLVWTPVTVNFGTTGQYQVTLAALSYTTQALQNLNATITLLADDVSQEQDEIPEPGTLALVGIGLLGYAAVSRRRRSRAGL